MQYIFDGLEKIFKGKNLMLVPCLYIVLWLLKKTPLKKKSEWITDSSILVLGILISAFLGSFEFTDILLGFLASGIVLYAYEANEKKNKCRETPCKKRNYKQRK